MGDKWQSDMNFVVFISSFVYARTCGVDHTLGWQATMSCILSTSLVRDLMVSLLSPHMAAWFLAAG